MRLTRAETQARTHAGLLTSGRQVFLRRGFLAATVEEIAADAGYTRGAVYKHFGGKEGLWLAVVSADAGTHLEGLRAALSQTTSVDELVAVLSGVADAEAAKWAAVAAEVLAATAAQPEISAQIAAVQEEHDAQVTALLEEHVARLGLMPAMPVRQVVVLLGALGIGLALRQAFLTGTDARTVLSHVLKSALTT
ncbi:TetR/AcrR family transcriptional regulator [Lentzea sp. JNUCC 0626]|uniref:TetR/AcrR family transcriptional regulator n=1 Tax=Lentzea sp. JNUCC 0626 TaxID=3367513 RepID=UPI003747CA7D